MAKSLLFIPDISGYTKFIQTTEIEHSQHVISELLEVLISANTQGLQLAEIEGDALFFYKENTIPSQENLLAQIEAMFTAFYSHLKLLEQHRICPCNACATAPNLELKIIAHTGNLTHIEVQGNRKPFGEQVIEAHRLLKNSVDSDNYALISRKLALEIQLSPYYSSKVFRFRQGSDQYDDRNMEYVYSLIDTETLHLKAPEELQTVSFDHPPQLTSSKEFPISAPQLLEYITNYSYRDYWVKGVDKFDYNENEVTRLGTKHTCVVNGKNLDFTTITKEAEEGNLIYGEITKSPPIVDELYQFFVITPLGENRCRLELQNYWKAKSPIKKILISLVGKKSFKKGMEKALQGLHQFITNKDSGVSP
ncbi:DUF2652 domain-containing protein [Flagellimonas allohymeniacidonis]|uniref:DUF2652 domain-containing protein n=1 Tax=Flagellimonas allohymeniacidonis TaxID=2517819 RepID=A0A4Q8QFY2_9FLAO|nr:DUF2652 domain-containing protein [Allomuricauda hymeniacidonis]TAI48794.1 DUF2652 domain-containing protein [Allomuricauda hymeniacidonis]